MKIDISKIDLTQFMVHQHIINGEVCTLVQPQFIGVKWTQENKIFRSSLWNSMGELLSAGFSKFTNWGENPDNFPVPSSLKDTVIVEKIDGSLLIVSKYKGQYILRTRGTSDAYKLDNGFELEFFKQKYIELLDTFMSWEPTWKVSFLFEWVSPLQKIILNYGDNPEWYLVGIVNHHDYSLWLQNEVTSVAAYSINAPRPPCYTFPSIQDLIKNIEAWKGKEGIVIYSNNGQSLHKSKSMWYLNLHRMKESLSSIDKVIDVWFEQDRPPYQTFEDNITKQFDFDLWQQIRGEASKICDAWKGVEKIIEGMRKFVDGTLRPMATRREQAERVISSYSVSNRASMVFSLLDSKPLTSEQGKKLLYQVLKK